jgi:hypothetical protein
VTRVIEMTAQGFTQRLIALSLRRNQHVISDVQRRLGIKRRQGTRPPSDPTPEEIAQRAAEVRQTWPWWQEMQANVGQGEAWRPTAVHASVMQSAIDYADG